MAAEDVITWLSNYVLTDYWGDQPSLVAVLT